MAATTSTATEIAKPRDGRIVIQPGNNLWRISRVIYGSGTKYTVLFESNKDQIRNPDLIFPGQVFMTPDVVPPETIDPTRRDSLKPEEGGTAG
ncbi:MAG: LysM peptidoglycan-binding domain-containing protein [Rhizobiales bacterium]|nr:LysM peptidoglycan-binding domain-containing protein [Hyphomicrobiales bacterium]